MGNGRQYVSWIHEKDFCRAVAWILSRDDLSGPINVAAPHPVTNGEMMHILRELCHAPLGWPATPGMLEVGTFLLRTESELVIKSRRVVPRRLLESGFQFHFPFFKDAARDLLSLRA